MSNFSPCFSYNRVNPLFCVKISSLISLIPGFLIFGCVVDSVPFATVYDAAGMGLCCAAIHRVNTIDDRRWCGWQ